MRALRIGCSLLLLVFCLIAAAGCDKKVSNGGGQQATAFDFSGSWEGTIQGQRVHFVGNPEVRLNLQQSDSLLNGTISTSDSAFQNVPICQGNAWGDSLRFYAIQSAIYPGAEMRFTARRSGNTINGEWNHINAHKGSWSATRQPGK
ncbi:MAG: hypothetical protein Kow0042_00380 [Calditrichia bacterium]